MRGLQNEKNPPDIVKWRREKKQVTLCIPQAIVKYILFVALTTMNKPLTGAQKRRQKREKAGPSGLSDLEAKRLLSNDLVDGEFAKDTAAKVSLEQAYVDVWDEPQVESSHPNLVCDLEQAPTHMREMAEKFLKDAQTFAPMRAQRDIRDEQRIEVTTKPLTLEELLTRCNSWKWSSAVLKSPLALFINTERSRAQQNALMTSADYLHAEMQLCEHWLAGTANEKEAITAATKLLVPHFYRLLLAEQKPYVATATQRNGAPASYHFCIFQGNEQLGQAMLCVVMDIAPGSSRFICHFYVPPYVSTPSGVV